MRWTDVAGAAREWCRDQACALHIARFGVVQIGGCDPHHVRGKGAGGIDRENLAPLCGDCHEYAQRRSVAMVELETGVCLRCVAKATWARWVAEARLLGIPVMAPKGTLFAPQP